MSETSVPARSHACTLLAPICRSIARPERASPCLGAFAPSPSAGLIHGGKGGVPARGANGRNAKTPKDLASDDMETQHSLTAACHLPTCIGFHACECEIYHAHIYIYMCVFFPGVKVPEGGRRQVRPKDLFAYYSLS